MARTRLDLGRRGERLAEQKLQTCGYEIVARNYRCAGGEVDLVARQAGVLVFVEVRTRRGTAYGTPEESITPRKRQHLITAAQRYLQEHQLADVAWRLDVVAVALSTGGTLERVDIIENAIQG